MTMKACIGFEWGSYAEDPNITAFNIGFDSSVKRQGAYSSIFGGGSGNDNNAFNRYLKLSTAGLSEYYLQFGFYSGGMGNTLAIFQWLKDATVLGGIKFNSVTGKLDVYRDNFSNVVGSLSVSYNAWQVIELHIKIADSGGIIQARKDMGALSIDYTGDTKPGADTIINNFQWGNPTQASYYYVDDIVLNDTAGSLNNSWPGGLRIIRLAPTGDNGAQGFTPTPASTHYSAIDEVPPVGTDNIVAASAALVDNFTLADCPADVATIAAAQFMAFGFKGSSNAPTRVALGLNMAGGDHYTNNLDLSVSQAVVKEIWEVSPDTGGATPLTVAEINAAKLLVKSVA